MDVVWRMWQAVGTWLMGLLEWCEDGGEDWREK